MWIDEGLKHSWLFWIVRKSLLRTLMIPVKKTEQFYSSVNHSQYPTGDKKAPCGAQVFMQWFSLS
jgi:hypothetical protein